MPAGATSSIATSSRRTSSSRDDGRAKLVDMGLARLHQVRSPAEDLTASGVTLGTFDYISPEQARDPRSADVRSDIYSLGCTFYYMLTARPPFPDGTVLQKLLQHQGDDPPDPRSIAARAARSRLADRRQDAGQGSAQAIPGRPAKWWPSWCCWPTRRACERARGAGRSGFSARSIGEPCGSGTCLGWFRPRRCCASSARWNGSRVHRRIAPKANLPRRPRCASRRAVRPSLPTPDRTRRRRPIRRPTPRRPR